MDHVAMQSCTSGRNVFFTGMYPLRTGMIPPQLPGMPTYLKPGNPALAKFLLDLGYNTVEFGKNHLGDHTEAATNSARLPGDEQNVSDWIANPVTLRRMRATFSAEAEDNQL